MGNQPKNSGAPDLKVHDTPARASTILASLLRDRGLRLYSAATLLGAPIWLWKKWRLKRYLNLDCEFDAARWTLRFPDKLNAQPKNARDTNGPRVMFFTPGWGDVGTMKPLVEALRAARPHARLLFTTKHHEAIMPAAQLSDEAVAPLPFDNPLSVARWLQTTQPDVVIFYERFLYATLLRSLWIRGVPFLIFHARMRRTPSRSAPNVAFKKWQLRGLKTILLSMPEFAPGVRQLVQREEQIKIVGSIKFPHQKPALTTKGEADLRAWIEAGSAGAPILAAGSTHETEEEFVLDAFQTVRQSHAENAPILLLAPRKPRRTSEVVELIRARGLRVSLRSQADVSKASTLKADVLLLDTLGELNTAYQWATGAFVGGTVMGDSHNVTEPLAWSIPVTFGPRKGNFEIEQRLCEEAGVGFRVHAPDELAAHWTHLLDSPATRAELALKIDALIEEQNHSFARILQVLIDAVDSVDKTKSRAPEKNTISN